MRKSFAQVLKEGRIDIKREYERLYSLMFSKDADQTSIYDDIGSSFDYCWFKGTAISLEDFNEEHGFNFEKKPENPTIDDLVNFCEYFYNMVITSGAFNSGLWGFNTSYYAQHIYKVIENLGYTATNNDGLTIFVEKDPGAISVSEILPEDVSYKVISYNHYSMKGNIESKKETLVKLAKLLEPKDKELNQIDHQFKSDLFNAFNNLNIRHNNIDPKDKSQYHKYVDEMDKAELEKWYDEVYQMCLLAFLRLEHADRKPQLDELMKKVHEK